MTIISGLLIALIMVAITTLIMHFAVYDKIKSNTNLQGIPTYQPVIIPTYRPDTIPTNRPSVNTVMAPRQVGTI